MPEFDVTVLTFRSGSHTVRVQASDPAAARGLVQAELDSGESHCPAEWCTDDVDSTLLDVKQWCSTTSPPSPPMASGSAPFTLTTRCAARRLHMPDRVLMTKIGDQKS